MMDVEVVYAHPGRQVSVHVQVPAGATIATALDAACAKADLAGVNWREHQVGVFGQVRDTAAPLQCGDRVEIYRPLLMDAKSARRHRAELQRGD